jgi:predicted N-acyltransferase
MQRKGLQFHFPNPGYGDYEEFLAMLTSRKRKALRAERRKAQQDVEIVALSGTDLHAEHWDAFYGFYQDTGLRKWGSPYLNRDFFDRIHQTMADHVLMILAKRDGKWIAGALNFIGGDCLFGRYWGCVEYQDSLHFELCYHQAIEHAIARGLPRVEAGAQGSHKIARGYLPVLTRSFHHIPDPGFAHAVSRFLDEETNAMHHEQAACAALSPYRQSAT